MGGRGHQWTSVKTTLFCAGVPQIFSFFTPDLPLILRYIIGTFRPFLALLAIFRVFWAFLGIFRPFLTVFWHFSIDAYQGFFHVFSDLVMGNRSFLTVFGSFYHILARETLSNIAQNPFARPGPLIFSARLKLKTANRSGIFCYFFIYMYIFLNSNNVFSPLPSLSTFSFPHSN
jgi:hypothetical protein